MTDSRQTTIYDVIERREDEERVAATSVSTTRAVRCECGAWIVTDQRKARRQCGLCGRFAKTEGR